MAQTATSTTDRPKVSGPPKMKEFDHVSLPCRDLDEAIRFYRDVIGGELKVREPEFALFNIAGTRFGVSSAGCTFMTRGAEYPHVAFVVDADALVRMKEWLAACGVPSSNFWTRKGVETLMFFRDPSGNIIELFCHGGYADAPNLPRGPAQGHGTALDIDSIGYTSWRVPNNPA
jgi:catechol 2,3-dioxygenase-like lactoylglutathione lyase family enzyme